MVILEGRLRIYTCGQDIYSSVVKEILAQRGRHSPPPPGFPHTKTTRSDSSHLFNVWICVTLWKTATYTFTPPSALTENTYIYRISHSVQDRKTSQFINNVKFIAHIKWVCVTEGEWLELIAVRDRFVLIQG